MSEIQARCVTSDNLNCEVFFVVFFFLLLRWKIQKKHNRHIWLSENLSILFIIIVYFWKNSFSVNFYSFYMIWFLKFWWLHINKYILIIILNITNLERLKININLTYSGILFCVYSLNRSQLKTCLNLSFFLFQS